MSRDNNETFKDQNTPVNEPLRGIYKKSFGFISLYRRMPDLFAQIIENLEKEPLELNEKENMQNAIDDIKLLLNEIINNKSLRKIDSTFNLAILWNQILDEKLKLESSITWFGSEWLFTENYLYIRIKEVFERTSTLKNFDPFKCLKLKAFQESETSMIALGEFILSKLANTNTKNDEIKFLFKQTLKVSLWGNRCDLSLSAGKSTTISEDPSKTIQSLDTYLIADKSDEIWEALQKSEMNNKTKQIDIILDNAAYELFTDLCFADFVLTFNLADTVVFHGKAIPWYVSDVTKPDFESTLYYLENKCSSSVLNNLGRRWTHYYKNDRKKIKRSRNLAEKKHIWCKADARRLSNRHKSKVTNPDIEYRTFENRVKQGSNAEYGHKSAVTMPGISNFGDSRINICDRKECVHFSVKKDVNSNDSGLKRNAEQSDCLISATKDSFLGHLGLAKRIKRDVNHSGDFDQSFSENRSFDQTVKHGPKVTLNELPASIDENEINDVNLVSQESSIDFKSAHVNNFVYGIDNHITLTTDGQMRICTKIEKKINEFKKMSAFKKLKPTEESLRQNLKKLRIDKTFLKF